MTDAKPSDSRPDERPPADGLPPRFVGTADEVTVTLPPKPEK